MENNKNEAKTKKSIYKKWWFWLLVVVVIGAIGGSAGSGKSEKKSATYTPISDFEYTIKDNTITLDEYKGSDETIVINSEYTIKDVKYNVVGFSHAIFNGCDARSIYIPKTIKTVYDDTLAYLGDDDYKVQIYYAGTKKQWKKVFTTYDSSKDSENAGEKAADKLNKLFGHEYNEENFEYHFDSKIEDVK